MSPFEHGEFFVLDDGGEVFYPSSLQIGGEMNLDAGIQVAQLALKHRQNKKQQQRIIVFAGSSYFGDDWKNSVALDIINFGEEDEEKSEKLEALLAAVNNNDTSHIVHVSAGPSALSDVLISTPIFTGDGEGGSGIKIKSIVEASKPWPSVSMSRWLLTVNHALPFASLQMSVQEGEKDSASDKDMSKLLADQSFVSSILASLPGVDPNDPSVRDLLASMQNQSEFYLRVRISV
ncbi:putative von Willebrand factor, type A, proteasome subunit Rpn10 [Rosa chinensis]|uniref:Putative von Willebrand factor, type A, proteasome subunit Rpn10 n=1 Tax=Rosa chinensis TaxID=74649 RepID=A0A2P6PRF8_ROSCH|nr:putative von Willebrand factor, type A, proteasome subunit Rpn10 [Rosa chinensis]